MLESSFSRVRFVFLVQGNDWSNVGKLVFKSSIRFLGSGQRLIECWKAHFQEFDSFSWFRATTDRMLESSFSRVRFVYLVQGNDWSNVGKLIFKSSIRFLGSGQRLIECWKAHFQEFDSFSWFRATTDRMLESSFSRVRFVFSVQGNDWSNVGKLVFKSSIRFLGSGQRLIECWKARFQEFDSFSWFRARTDRALESSFSRVQFVYLVQGNDWSNVGKLVFKSSIRFLGSGQGLIECWKARFQEFDSFSWFRATTHRMLESSFSRVRFVFLVQGNDWSNVGKLVFKSSIRLLGSGQRLIECWKARFQEFDSFTWFRATTDRMLESSFSRVWFVYLVQGNDWSNVGKLIFKSSIRFLGSGQGLIECWKARFQEFDSFFWFRATTDRMLESSFSRVRFVFLVQGNDWSNVGKLVFKSSIRFLGSGQRLIECWKAHFQEFDSISWFRATTDRMLESSFSRVRFVYLVQGNDWSNVGKLIFKSSIRFLGSGQRLIERYDWSNVGKLIFNSSIRFLGSWQQLIECWKARFQEFDSFSWFRATTDRMLESSFSRVRFVFLVQGNDWSNVGKLVFKSSIRFLGSGQGLIECWKARFQEFDSFSWFRATTDRMLESSFSRVRFVFLVQGNDWSSVGKLIFKSSIRFLGSGQGLIEHWKAHFQEFDSFPWFRATTSKQRLIESGKLVFKSSIRYLGSGQRLIECWKAHFQEFDSFSWFRATTDRMLESSFSRVRFVFLVQGNDWSSVGKLVFKSSIRFLGSGQRLIECWKAHFQEFDSFTWFRATTDRALESSFSRVRFVYLVQGNDWSNVGKLVFKSSIRFLGSGQGLIECWKAHFQEFDSFSWFRATTDRALESSFSRVRFVFLVQGNDWSNVGKLVFKSSIRFLGSGQGLIECWKARFQEFDSFSWFRATTDRALESSFSRVRFVFLVQGKDWSNVGKLIFKSSICFLGSGQRLQGNDWSSVGKLNFQEFDSFSWFRATTDRALESSFSRVRFVFLVQGNDWSNVGKLIFKSSIRFLGSGQRLIERWKARFQEFDSFSWFRATTDRMLESSFSRVRFIYLVQGNDWSSVGKLIFKSSIRFLGSGQRLIECWKARFQEFDSFSWFRARTDRVLESSFSRVRFVYLVQGNDWSSVGKLVFKSSIRFLGSGQRLIERWKAHFQEFDSFSWFRATTDRMLESSFSRVRFVFLVQGNDWSSVGKLIFKSSIRLLGSGQRLIECWKAHFQEFDSFSWFRATTDRMLESSFSRVRFVFLVQGNDWSNVGKLVFKSSIRFLGSGQRLIECWKAHFQEFDSFSWFRATTDRMLERSFSRVRFVFLVQGNDWSNVGKLIFKSSIRLLGSGQRLIECWKARFQEFDSFTWFRATTDRMLESSFSRVRFVFLVQGKDWSNVGKLIFKCSIRFLGSGQRLIERWKAHFQEFDSFSWFRATTDRALESSFSRVRFVFLVQGNDFKATTDRALKSSFSRVRFVFLVQGNDWSSVGKLIFKSSIRFLGSGQRLIECWKAHFQEFDSFSWFRATTDRTLESSFSRVRFVFLVQGKDWSNVGKLVFKSSIRFLGSGQRLIECWKARFQEFDSFSWFRATTDRALESSFLRVRFVFLVQGNDWLSVTTDQMLESSFSRVRFVFLVQGNDWSSVGKLVFKSSIRFLGSGQRLIECWKAHFQEFDSFSWFRATTDRMLESSFSRVRFVFLVQGNDWSNVGKLVFKSSIRFLGSGQRLIECWKAHFQEFDSFTWFRATTDRALESSFSRVRFVFLVQGNDWSNVGKLVFKSSIRFLGSGQGLIECWKARFQEFDSFSWFRATTDRALESSFSRVRFVFLVQGNDWSSVGKLIFKSSIRFLGSGQRLIECWKARFQEFDSFSWFRARTDRMLESSFSRVRFVFLVQGNDWSNVGKLIFKSSIRFLGSGQRLIERWKAHFQEFDSFSWFRARTDRALESSFSRVRFVFLVQGNDFKATTDRALESSFSRVRFVFLVQGNDWSSVGKLIFKSSIRFLGSGQRLIECWKAHFQEFDSFSWFRATTDRMLESSFSRVRFVFLVQGNDWSNVGKLIFKSSIHLLGSGQRLIERWKAHFQEFDSFSRFRATTDRMLESSFSRVRFVFLVQGKDWSSVGKLIFKSSIRLLGSGQRLIERWKARFQEFDSFSWFRATTDRMLESSFSRVRFVFLVQGNDWSNVGKLIFKSSIRFLGSGQRLIECWKAHFQEFDSFSWFRATTDRMLESSFSRVRFVFLVQSNDWSNVGKLVFKSSIRFLGSGQGLIECWKARFQEFDSFSWFRATTDRMLESSFSRVRFVFLVQGNDWSNVGKIVFKSSIRFLGSGQGLIECWKAHFQEFDSFTWFRATTDRMLESSFSRVRFVFLVQGNDWSNVGKFIFKSSIRFLGSGQGLIECWKAHFQEFDSFSWFRATTDRALESSFSRVRFVSLVQGKDWSSVGKLIFKSSIRFLGSGQRLQGNEWSSVEKLVFKSSIQFLGSGQRLIERWKAHFQEFDSFSWFRATTDRMLESSFSRVRFVFLVQGNDWSNVGKLVFKSSIRFLGSGQRLIECWKARFQEFDSFSWFRATTDRMLESSFSRVRFVFLVQGNDWSSVGKLIFKSSIRFLGSGQRLIERYDWSNVGKLIFKSSIRFLGSGQRLIECWKARFQEFDSFSWFRATTDRMLESSFSRVRFVYLVQGNDWSNVGKLVFKSSIRFLGSGQGLIECWKARFQEFDSFSWFRATTDRMLESSFSRVRFVFLVQGNDWSSVGKLIFKSSIRFLGSGQWLIECWKARFQEFDSFSWFRARTDRVLEYSFSRVRFVFLVQGNDWSSVGKLIFKSSIRFLGSGQRLIERWKAHFQEFDSFSWFRATTDRMLESSFSRVRFVFLVQGKDWSSVGKLVFKSSIRFLGSGQRLIECWKAHFQEFDSFSWFRATTDRALESSFSRVRFVFLVQGKDWSSVGKLIFKSSIRFLGSGQQLQGNDWSSVGKLIFKSSIRFLGSGQWLIERWKAHFQEFDSFSWFRATTDRVLESSFSRVRFVFLVQGNDWSNVGKLVFKSSIRLLGSGQRLIECWKAHFQEFDSFTWFKATTDRALESSFSRVRFVFLVQGNDWSNVGKLVFKSSIRFLGSGQGLIECWKAHFQEFDSFTWFRATTDRALESSFSRVRFVFLVQGNDWSSVGKLNFKNSIRFLGSGQRLIECWKAHFQEFDSFSWFRATTDRMLESSFSRVRFVFLVQGNDWSNVGKLILKSSIRFLGSEQRLIECWKARFQEFDSFTWFRATTDRMLESSFSRVRFVFLVQGNDSSNVGKLIFKSSIRFLGSGQGLIECWKDRFQEFDSFSWFRARTDRALESSFSRVRFVYLVQGNDWSNVGKLVFKSSIRFLGSGQRLIECWKAHFQEFDSFSWFRARTDRMLESSFSRVRFVFLVQGNDWRKRIELLKTSFPTFDQSLPWTKKTNRTLENELSNIRSVLALNQENESNSWKWAFQHSISRCPEPLSVTTDQMLESSFSRVRFVFLVHCNDWSSVGKLVFKSSIRFLGSGQRLIECWKAHFQEFDSFSWFRATTDRMLESSFSRVRFVFLVQGNDWRKRIELLKMSFPTFDQSLPWTKKTNRTLENELSNIRSVVALNQVNESNSWKWAFQHSISLCPEPRKRIELLKTSFPTFDQSLPWTKKTNRTLENELSNARSVVALNQENESNSWKRAFQHSISPCPEPRKRIELLKTSFPTFDQSLPWTKKTNRTLENELSNARSVVALNQGNESNSWKRAFQHSISPCPEPRKRIELLKTSFPTFDQSLPWTKKTNRTLENELSNARSVVALNQENESNSWKWAFQHSISRCPEPRKRIELLKMSFPTLDQSLPWTKKTNRTLENELSNARSVVALKLLPWTKKTNRTLENELSNARSVLALNQENESNSWKWAFQRSISRCPEPRKRIELLKMSFPTLDQSLPWTK